ncbi:MAG: CBS domain-containing protein [Candidatus Eremiobacteraeota bacterium]|nr:CBS domain-containing protein [Candidatus Eremiobacteraeota bacterium]
MEIIISHISADFDSLASMVAAQKLYPQAKLYFTGSPEQPVSDFMQLYRDFITVKFARNPSGLPVKKLIIVDCRNPNRLGDFRDLVNSPQVEVHIYDHHPPSLESIKGDVNIIEKAGATTTILMKMLLEKKIYLSPLEATLMALGIYEETGSLLFTGTTPDDAFVVGRLLEMGVNLQVVSDFVLHYLNEEQRKILNKLILSSTVMKIKGFRILTARCRVDEYVDGIALVAHRLNDLERPDGLFVLVEMAGRIYIVGRSIRGEINVNRILKFFGGGGHPTAASAVVKGKLMSDIEYKLKKTLQRYVKSIISAGDVMSSPVKILELKEGMLLNDAFSAMRRVGHFNLPIMENGKLVGIVDRTDLDKAKHHGYGKAPLNVYMSKPVTTTGPDASIYQLQNQMMKKGIGCLPVLKNDVLIGIVTRQDVLEAIYRRDLDRHRKKDRPIDRLKKLPEFLRKMLKVCGIVGDKLKMRVFVVGGFVRDLLMGVENLDVDIVVEGDGILFGEQLSKKLDGRVKSHEKFGTSVVVLPDGMHIDVASSRTEYYTRPAALPDVMESSIKQDLYRRDFTINALAIRLNRRFFGELLDFFGCRKDLRNGVIRVLHPMSFVDDPTRILRAVKFEQRYQFHMDQATENLLRDALSKNIFDLVSPERFRNEFIEILEEARPLPAIRRMDKLRILRLINKNIDLDSRMIDVFEAITAILVKYVDIVKKEGVKQWVVYFNALVMRLDPLEIIEIAERFRIPKNIVNRAGFDKKEIHDIIRTLCSRTLKVSELYRTLEGFSLETLFFIMARARTRVVRTKIAQFIHTYRHIKPMVGGNVLKEWGIPTGPAYKEILRILFDAQLDEMLTTLEGAREFYNTRLKSLLGKGIREKG